MNRNPGPPADFNRFFEAGQRALFVAHVSYIEPLSGGHSPANFNQLSRGSEAFGHIIESG